MSKKNILKNYRNNTINSHCNICNTYNKKLHNNYRLTKQNSKIHKQYKLFNKNPYQHQKKEQK